jgi:hypothetical protein
MTSPDTGLQGNKQQSASSLRTAGPQGEGMDGDSRSRTLPWYKLLMLEATLAQSLFIFLRQGFAM